MTTPMRLAMKLGVFFFVVRVHHLLAQDAVGEGGERGYGGGIGICGGNDLEQPHVARRIEEVRAEKPLALRVAEARGDLRNGQAGGVGGEQGVGREVRRHAGQQRGLDARFSATASMTQSQAASLGRSSSKVPGVMSAADAVS